MLFANKALHVHLRNHNLVQSRPFMGLDPCEPSITRIGVHEVPYW